MLYYKICVHNKCWVHGQTGRHLCPQQITKFPQRMLYYQIPLTYAILPNSPNVCYITKFPNVCYITKFPQRMLYYQIPSAYVILLNSLSVCYITKFPQRMLYCQIPPTYDILLSSLSVCYIAKFPKRMLYYQIPSAYVILPNSLSVCYITKFVSTTNVGRAGKRGDICVRNNVSSFARVCTPNLIMNQCRRPKLCGSALNECTGQW